MNRWLPLEPSAQCIRKCTIIRLGSRDGKNYSSGWEFIKRDPICAGDEAGAYAAETP